MNNAILAFIGAFAIIPITAIWGGYVISILWGWFMVPIFALHPLGIAQAIGVNVMFHLFAYKRSPSDPEEKNGLAKSLVAAFMMPATFLLYGWVVQHWI